MYLLVKGNTQRSSNYSVVQKQMESNPVYSGDTATLECSVFSDSENKTCPGDHNVFWFRAGSHPNIYTDRKRHNEYENRYNPQKRCVYNTSSCDNGNYYCGVVACGEILFGNGTALDIQEPVLQKNFCCQKTQQNKDTWMFSAVVFTMMKADRWETKEPKVVEKHELYKAVKAFGLE
ncbi:uncharacterized protein LOC100702625 isoform X5 [Oreochromis niloticus]|uniref:uncharacterized protein LOC100702625 isoform X5 n=1 Tax=Oreochromis niloticus TaxID=8128 RepID=UPI000DF1C85F|nr:uncharacterized protein LOC100702625 isoform X5 [Oreochromis niloticus]CAI5652779.1 unnamed protein product [Mustela putorius furo]